MLISKANLETEIVNAEKLKKELNYVLYYDTRSQYYHLLKEHDITDNPEDAIKIIIENLVFPNFDSKDYGIVSEEKSKEQSFDEAIELAIEKVNRDLEPFFKKYKRYPVVFAHILKHFRPVLSKKRFMQYKNVFQAIQILFKDKSAVKQAYKKYCPENLPENYLASINSKAHVNPFDDDICFYAVSLNHLKHTVDGENSFILNKYYLEAVTRCSNYDRDAPDVDFTLKYHFKTDGNMSYSEFGELKTVNGVLGLYLREHSNYNLLTFTDKNDAIEHIKKMHQKNEEYLNSL